MSDLQENFQNPPRRFRPNPIVHRWPEARTTLMDAIADYGFGGVVTNVPFENGFTQNPGNLAAFRDILSELDARGLSYWLYDENGYPSGYVGGAALEGHPELAATGFYMRRRAAYEQPMTVRFRTEDETDRIVWAARYPLRVSPRKDDCHPDLGRMEAVPFGHDTCTCRLGPFETLYLFCARPTHEGSQATHNTCSFKPYINLLDPRAVQRFIELVYEPMAKAVPDAFSRATAVFTDEPSLMTAYPRSYEVWPWAFVPWTEGLFEAFETEYGFSLLPWLPLLFEGGTEAGAIRTRFYELVGKLAARAYSGALQRWCAAHGGVFSGHYLCEESHTGHIVAYGSFCEVLKQAGLPGLDVLSCVPERFCYNTVKYPQMVDRKRGEPGLMVEICPFADLEEFRKDPVENMTGVVNLLYLSGVRHTNSYFSSDFSAYDPARLSGMRGTMSRSQARQFAAYVGRLGAMLSGARNECGIFVYAGAEDAEARFYPHTSDCWRDPSVCETDAGVERITRAVFEAGFDYAFADAVDLAAAVKPDIPAISGIPVRAIMVPPLAWMDDGAWSSIQTLAAAGVPVFFLDRLPRFSTAMPDASAGEAVLLPGSAFSPMPLPDILAALRALPDVFSAESEALLFMARFTRSDGREMRMLCNGARTEAQVRVSHAGRTSADVFDPQTGACSTRPLPDTLSIAALRALFLVF